MVQIVLRGLIKSERVEITCEGRTERIIGE